MMEPALANNPSFLPGTNVQFAWDSTSLGVLKECPRKYYYTMIEGWVSHGISPHLTFGLIYHAALERYDRARATGADHEAGMDVAVNYALTESYGFDSDIPKKNRDTLLRTVVWYLDHFKDDPAETVILPDGKPAVELSFKMEIELAPSDSANPYLLCGHLDRLVKFGGDLFVMDRKTTGSALGAYYFSDFNPHNQMSLYTMAAKVIFHMPVAGVIIDAAQVLVGSSVFGRAITSRSDAQLEEWLHDTGRWLMRAEEYAANRYWPMNDMSCHKYGGCPFRRVCSADPAVRQNFLETDFTKRIWNPLETRE